MLNLSAWMLMLTAAGGLLALAVRGAWWPGLLHGLCGIAGLAVLLAALGGPPHGVHGGMRQFGAIAGGFLGGAVLIGLVFVARRLRGRPPPGWAVGVHACLAVCGLALLLAYAGAGD